MEWMSLAFLVIKAINAVEELYKDIKGNGSVKKATVLNIAQSAVDIVGGVSSGGQKMTAQQVSDNLGTFVDAAVGVMNTVAGKAIVTEENTMGHDVGSGA